jgi:glycosyltransferase involved in cell wall biosynthesis
MVSELMPHKEIDIAIHAFNHLRLPLVVIGDGPDARRLRRLAGPTVSFTGRVRDETVAEVLRTARALVMTAVEEFGIVAVEAQASGRPVIARRGGGALETVVDGITGCFWSGGWSELAQAVREFDVDAVDPQACLGNAARFDAGVFRRRMLAEVDAAAAEPSPVVAERQPLPSTRLVRRATRDLRL